MLSAAGLLAYLQRTYATDATPVPSTILKQAFMDIDAATRKSLELTHTLSVSGRQLLHAIDFTRTAAGARLLHSRISAPLTDRSQIELRLGLANWFSDQPVLCQQISDYMKLIPDLDRSLSRIASDRGGPRDIASLAEGLRVARQIAISCLSSDHIDMNHEIAR